MAFNWDFDMGGAGFGKADYAEALRRGGGESLDRTALENTRQAVKRWMLNPGHGQTIAPKIKEWVTGGTDLGSTMYGGTGQNERETNLYGKADLWADVAQGRSFSDIQSHFTDTPANLSKIPTGGDVFKILSQAANEERATAARTPLQSRITDLEGQVTEAEGVNTDLQTQLEDALSHSADLETNIDDLGEQLSGSQAGYEELKTEYQTELDSLRDAQAVTRSNAPVRVRNPSPLSIRFAQGPKKTGFRGTLAGLTRPVAASNKLKSTALNV